MIDLHVIGAFSFDQYFENDDCIGNKIYTFNTRIRRKSQPESRLELQVSNSDSTQFFASFFSNIQRLKPSPLELSVFLTAEKTRSLTILSSFLQFMQYQCVL